MMFFETFFRRQISRNRRWNIINPGFLSTLPASVAQRQSVALGLETRLCHLVFPLGKEIKSALLCGLVRWKWAETSQLFADSLNWRARSSPLNCENEPQKLTPGKKTGDQAVVGSIVWVFRRLKKPRSREMSARSYALHNVCRQLSFLVFRHWTRLHR